MLRRAILLSLYASVVAFPALLGAQWAPILTGVSHQLPSQALGESRDIYVVLPPGYATDTLRHPVLVLLDGDGLLPPTLGLQSFLAASTGLTRSILVAVRSRSPQDRIRLFTPPPDSATRARFATAGGARAFQDFLGRELVPHIAEHYRTDGRWGLVGHSLAGLLVIQSFSDPESAFGTFVAISPTLGWQDQAILTSTSASLRQPARPRRLFLSTAEEGPRYPAAPTQRLDSLLAARRIPGISWILRHYPSEDHVTTVPPALYDALRWMHQP